MTISVSLKFKYFTYRAHFLEVDEEGHEVGQLGGLGLGQVRRRQHRRLVLDRRLLLEAVGAVVHVVVEVAAHLVVGPVGDQARYLLELQPVLLHQLREEGVFFFAPSEDLSRHSEVEGIPMVFKYSCFWRNIEIELICGFRQIQFQIS